MTENRGRVLEVLNCSQIASRPSINKSLRWVACKCSPKYKAQPPPLHPLRSDRVVTDRYANVCLLVYLPLKKSLSPILAVFFTFFFRHIYDYKWKYSCQYKLSRRWVVFRVSRNIMGYNLVLRNTNICKLIYLSRDICISHGVFHSFSGIRIMTIC